MTMVSKMGRNFHHFLKMSEFTVTEWVKPIPPPCTIMVAVVTKKIPKASCRKTKCRPLLPISYQKLPWDFFDVANGNVKHQSGGNGVVMVSTSTATLLMGFYLTLPLTGHFLHPTLPFNITTVFKLNIALLSDPHHNCFQTTR